MANMNIFPMNRNDADRRHWVVRWLRYNGYFICAGALIAGGYYGYIYSKLFSYGAPDAMQVILPILGVLLGCLLGFVGGLAVSLPFWGMSMIIDDLHALRIYASGYVAVGDREKPFVENQNV